MLWWHWAVLGFFLAGLEILTPGGFIVVFFGLAALVVAVLVPLGVAGPLWLQFLWFSVLSVVLLVLFRNPLMRWMQRRSADPPVDKIEGDLAIPTVDIAPGAVGKAELRGTTWTARNDSGETLAAGRRCRVTRVDGLVLFIQPE